MNKDPFREYIKESEPTKRDKGYAWHTVSSLSTIKPETSSKRIHLRNGYIFKPDTSSKRIPSDFGPPSPVSRFVLVALASPRFHFRFASVDVVRFFPLADGAAARII